MGEDLLAAQQSMLETMLLHMTIFCMMHAPSTSFGNTIVLDEFLGFQSQGDE